MQCSSHLRMILWNVGTPLPNYTTGSPKNSTRHSHHHETLKPHITLTCLHVLYTCYLSGIYRVSQEEMSIFWEVTVSVILSKRAYKYMCPIPNGFWDRAISLYSCKIVDKEIVSIVSNMGIYCSSDKVGAVYLVQFIFENSVNISSGTTIAEAVNVRHISIFGILPNTPTMSLSTVTTANWRFIPIHMLHTVAQYGGSEGQY
jgi:hypothetical protein